MKELKFMLIFICIGIYGVVCAIGLSLVITGAISLFLAIIIAFLILSFAKSVAEEYASKRRNNYERWNNMRFLTLIYPSICIIGVMYMGISYMIRIFSKPKNLYKSICCGSSFTHEVIEHYKKIDNYILYSECIWICTKCGKKCDLI